MRRGRGGRRGCFGLEVIMVGEGGRFRWDRVVKKAEWLDECKQIQEKEVGFERVSMR